MIPPTSSTFSLQSLNSSKDHYHPSLPSPITSGVYSNDPLKIAPNLYYQYQYPSAKTQRSLEDILTIVSYYLLLTAFWQTIYALLVLPEHSYNLYYSKRHQQAALNNDKYANEYFNENLPAIYQNNGLNEYLTFETSPIEVFNAPLWHGRQKEYWMKQSPMIDNMMDGFGFFHTEDLTFSNKFLTETFSIINANGIERSKYIALDAGAGIGRVTKYLLSHHIDTIDILEPIDQLRSKSREFINEEDGANTIDGVRQKKGKTDRYYDQFFQNYYPENERYDVIWVQWSLSYLTDDELTRFLQRMVKAVKHKNGVVILKENISPKHQYIVNERDMSVTRSMDVWNRVFAAVGCNVALTKQQENFPKYHYPVYMWALTPK